MGYSIIEYYGRQNGRTCGYCKGVKASISYGMNSYIMTVEDYQDLIDRGWRRSGRYCYKQENNNTCCPYYTIKCDALKFKVSKSHKKILKRMNRFLRNGKRDKNEELQGSNNKKSKDGDDDDDDDVCNEDFAVEEVKGPNVPLKNINLEVLAKSLNEKRNEENFNSQPKEINRTQNLYEEASSGSKKSFEGMNPPCKKAKQLRLERKIAKQAAKGLTMDDLPSKTPKHQEKSLNDFINDTRPDDKHKLKIVLVPSKKEIYTDTAFALYRKYQLFVHNDNPERLQPKNLQRFCYISPLKLSLIHVCSAEFQNTLSKTYNLYKKYQTVIHNDPPVDTCSYLDFLQRSPLEFAKPSDGPPCGYGSFHQQYWLDDKLIAVAVIDILPHCVSSVYFFYDPDYNFLSLGTYSSLREIELVQKFADIVPSLKFYYMGFYIHSCPKMRYKGKLSPSYLLCPEVYTWHLLTDEMREKLDICKYQRFNNDPLAKDVNEFSTSDLDSVLVIVHDVIATTYRAYKQFARNKDRDLIIEYGKLVGKTLAHRMQYITS